jgi:hypothetical protein
MMSLHLQYYLGIVMVIFTIIGVAHPIRGVLNVSLKSASIALSISAGVLLFQGIECITLI